MLKGSVVHVIAAVFGLAIACADLFADKGELSPGAILVLLAVAGAIVTRLNARLSIALAASVALWLPAIHLVRHALGRKSTLQPDTIASILLVGVVAFLATLAGCLAAAALRRPRARA